MAALPLHDFHLGLGGTFRDVNGLEAVRAYASTEQEYLHLTTRAAVLDLSFRGRICLLGKDREKFLHGQVTNDVLGLKPGHGCHAAIVDGKARLQADLFIYKLAEELLLDFEPSLTERLIQRLEKYVIADDVQVVDVAPHYALLSVQGPDSPRVVQALGWFPNVPQNSYQSLKQDVSGLGELYLMNNPRLNSFGFDLYIPMDGITSAAAALRSAVEGIEGGFAGLDAFEIARIEEGIPRFGVDMDETNLAPEAGLQDAISYSKGCYIGQEIIARIRTYGQVAKSLRLLRLPDELAALPNRGEKLFTPEGKEVGRITSSAISPKHGGKVALGYVRREANAPGTALHLGDAKGGTAVILDAAGEH